MLNREPMGMKRCRSPGRSAGEPVSVLNREPMGMKLPAAERAKLKSWCFSAQPRADGDEAFLRFAAS